jgi:uncharacterized heparinase superfamily protein
MAGHSRLPGLIDGALLYIHTLRHLKPVQVYGRVLHRLARPRVDLAPPPPLRPVEGSWTAPVQPAATLTASRRFRFLGVERDLDVCGWEGGDASQLWKYNLHYFQDLTAEGSAERSRWHSALMCDWVRGNPPGRGTGWDAYPVSVRVANWIKWALAGNELPPECLHSLAVQTRWLARRVEFHILGNHLIANAKALVFAGVFYDGPEAGRWLQQGVRILLDQLPEQLLADGGHFERSPMYHALILEDLLDLCNVLVAFPSNTAVAAPLLLECRTRPALMVTWLRAMCHPDGRISFFNDAAFGIAPTLAQLEEYAARLGLELPPPANRTVNHLSESGYVRMSSSAACAILDVAPVGASYQPAHAHADTLSFEFSVSGQRVFVNSGTSCYGAGSERHRQRGTAAHNTVVADGENSSEVWSGFRVARRARPLGLTIRVAPDQSWVRCAHDGYRRLNGHPLHTRTWEMEASALRIIDELSGSFQTAEARFHLHPAVRVESADSESIVLQFASLQHVALSIRGGRWRIDPATWHPEFGCTIPTACVVAEFDMPRIETTIRWSELD